jgi:hypothetical protein
MGVAVALMSAVPMGLAQTPVAASGQTPAAASAAAPPNMATVHQYLVGTWQSDSDTRSTRELDADGRTYDRLVGEESDSEPGHWSIFLGSAPPAKFSAAKFDPKIVYLEIDRDDDTLLFALLQVSRSELRMLYLQQHSEQAYSRLK